MNKLYQLILKRDKKRKKMFFESINSVGRIGLNPLHAFQSIPEIRLKRDKHILHLLAARKIV